MTNDLRHPLAETACKFIECGFGVIPLASKSKVPTAGSQGSKSPILDRDTASQMLSAHGHDINLGVTIEGFLVVDVDPRNGGDQSLEKLLDELRHFPETVTVRSGGGGQHFYFCLPDQTRNVRLRKNLSAFPGIDFKTNGYLVAPGSVHPSGRSYEFELGKALGDVPIAMAPEDLLDLLLVTYSAPQASDIIGPPGALASYEQIVEHCRVFSALVEHPESVSEPEWFAALTVIARTVDGERHAHEFSKLDEVRYDEAETRQKLGQAGKYNPVCCDHFHGELDRPECARCPFNGTIRSPISLGYGDPQLLKLQARFVYDVQSGKYYDVA